MFKKTLISLAVASSVGLSGCLDDGSTGANANPDYQISNPDFDGKTWPIFNPLTSELPIPNDLIFDSAQGDGTFGVRDSSPPVTTALNELSGASTVAPAVIQLNGQIDPATVISNKTVFLLELEYASGDPLQGLSNSEPPTVAGAANIRADVETLDGMSAIRILPIEPLAPRKRYIAVVTTDVKDLNGENIVASPSYQSLTDEEQPLGNDLLAPVRALINGLWEPSIQGATGLTDDKIAISYSFMTSNDENVLEYIAEPGIWFADQLETFVGVSTARRLSGAAQTAGGADLSEDINEDGEKVWDINGDGSVTNADFDVNGDGALTAADFDLDGNGKFEHNDVDIAVQKQLAAFPNEQILATNLGALFGAIPPNGCQGLTNVPAMKCVGNALASLPPPQGFKGLLPTPAATGEAGATSISFSSVSPVGLVSAVAARVDTGDAVLAAQGTMKLPYYLGADKSELLTDSWVADAGLAAGLNTAFASVGLEIPQADPETSTAVNYIFPFPKKQTDVTVPVLALYPKSGSVNGVVLYQHGITTDRSSALTFGTALAAHGYAVFAIDHPLHGVAAFTDKEQQGLASQLLEAAAKENSTITNDAATQQALIEGQLTLNLLAQLRPASASCTQPLSNDDQTAIQQVAAGACTNIAPDSAKQMAGLISLQNTVANAGSTIPGLAPDRGQERHFGFYSPVPGQVAPIDYSEGEGDSGSMFINLSSFLTSRDNNRQSIVDQMNLRANLDGLALPALAPTPTTLVTLDTTVTQADPDALPVYFAGHSLGTITGAPYIASVNKNRLNIAADAEGNGLSKALPLANANNDVKAASLLTPGGGVVRLLMNSPSFAPSIVLGLQQKGLEQGDASLESYLNIFQAAFDSADPVNFTDEINTNGTPLLLSQINGDTVIPNAADEMVWGIPPLEGSFPVELPSGAKVNVMVDSFSAPLAGGFPVSRALEPGVTGAEAASALDCLVTYDAGDHGTPTSAMPAAVFGSMVADTLSLFAGGPCDAP